ncbi:AAA family ATPase [Ralstonia sp. 22111]|uniref:AAA family ATPase n=1 Tax=Ralstonia sp. 22111 TaxID=3453878 RepID=UPI003F82F74A
MNARAPITPVVSMPDRPDATRFEFVSAGSLVAGVKQIDWLVEGYVESDSLALVFGEPGHGKSFIALDIACSVATGTEWHGHVAKYGAVFYIAGEGGNGLARRFQAWSEARGASLANAPLYVSTRSAALTESASAKTVFSTVRELAVATGETPALIVVDTLARNFGGGDENSAADMGMFISNLDLLRRSWQATVLIVHHSGKDARRGARGSTALRGAVDAEFEVTKGQDDVIRLLASKMKEADMPSPLAFRLRTVEFQDSEGNPITGAAPVLADAMPASKGGRGKHQVEMLRVLKQMEGEGAQVWVSAWESRIKESGIPRQRIHDAKKALVEHGLIELLADGCIRSLK